MAPMLRNVYISFDAYNTLPFIGEASEVPRAFARDLEDLQQLLDDYQVPNEVSIRLLHKHFTTEPGEIVVLRTIPLPRFGPEVSCTLMRPLSIVKGGQNAALANGRKQKTLQGIHYYYDSNLECLHAYEYAESDIPDMSEHEEFLTAFCNMIAERGLENRFGLKLCSGNDFGAAGFSEFEVDGQRSTITFPASLPLLPSAEYNVTTEWQAPSAEVPDQLKACHHTTSKGCWHGGGVGRRWGLDVEDNELGLSGQKLLPGSEVYNLVAEILAVAD